MILEHSLAIVIETSCGIGWEENKGRLEKSDTGINLKNDEKKLVKGTSEPSVAQITGDKRIIICELTVLDDNTMILSPFKVQHTDRNKKSPAH